MNFESNRLKGLLIVVSILFFECLSQVTVPIYTISTIAGTGSGGSGGDGLPGWSTALSSPGGIWLSSNGFLYFADTGNFVIRSVDAYETNGVVSIFAGSLGTSGDLGDGGPATAATFTNPYGVCGLSTGTIYVTDPGAHRIRSINAQGIINAVLGSSTTLGCGDGGSVDSPYLCRADLNGNLLIGDTACNSIRLMNTTSNTISRLLGTGDAGLFDAPWTLASYNAPYGAVPDTLGNIYIADSGNNIVRKQPNNPPSSSFLLAGSSTGASGSATALFNSPRGIYVSTNGNVFIADYNNRQIKLFNASSSTVVVISGNSGGTVGGENVLATSAKLNKVVDIIGDTYGFIFFTDQLENRVRKLTPGPVVSARPSLKPTFFPSRAPTLSQRPTATPSISLAPSTKPTTSTPTISLAPSYIPTLTPSSHPTETPSTEPTTAPTGSPSCIPTLTPSSHPTEMPSTEPTTAPTGSPSYIPTLTPSSHPTETPSTEPTTAPTGSPSYIPTLTPSSHPTEMPSTEPTTAPTGSPSYIPTLTPSSHPTETPSTEPTTAPTGSPSYIPTHTPSSPPTETPSTKPTLIPSVFSSRTPIPVSTPSLVQPFVSGLSHSPTFLPTASPSYFLLSCSSNHSNWKLSLSFFGSFSRSADSLGLLDVSSPSEGVSSIIFGSRALSSFDAIDASTPSSSSHYPVTQISPSFKRDANSRAASIPGDLNGDRYNDLIVCYPLTSSCDIFFGSEEDGLSNVKIAVTIYGAAASSSSTFFGFAVTGVEDINEDGYADVMISAVTGRACYVIYGRPSSLWLREMRVGTMSSGGSINEGADGYKILADASTTLTGLSVASTGDMNGDGKSDLAISAQRAGAFIVYVVWGEGGGAGGGKDVLLSEVGDGVKGLRVFGEQGYYTGFSISGVGDVNDDGFSDLVIGALPYPSAVGGGGKSQQQKSYVILGSSHAGMTKSDIVLGEGEYGGRVVILVGGGFIVSGPGDLNNDGIEDIMITDVRNYQGKGNAYIITYPGMMSSPPSFLPSSLPSSSPSRRPSSEPSFCYPTNSPSIRSLSSTSSSPAMMNPNVTGYNSSVEPLSTPTVRPTRNPSFRPSNQPRSFVPSKVPSFSPTRAPSHRPTTIQAQPIISQTKAPQTRSPILSPPTITSPSLQNTPRPSSESFASASPSSSLVPLSQYSVRAVSSSLNKQGIVNGNEGENEIFEISSISSDGKRRSGWSGTIIGGRGRKVYRISPKDPSQPVNRIILQDFDANEDMIDLSRISNIASNADLTYLTNPLTLFLPDNQKIVIASYQTMKALAGFNFIFQSVSSSSSDTPSGMDLFLDVSFLVPIIVVAAFLLISFLLTRQKETEFKEEKIVQGKRTVNEDASFGMRDMTILSDNLCEQSESDRVTDLFPLSDIASRNSSFNDVDDLIALMRGELEVDGDDEDIDRISFDTDLHSDELDEIRL